MAFVVTPSPFKYISVACWCLQEVLSCAVVLEKVRQALTGRTKLAKLACGTSIEI